MLFSLSAPELYASYSFITIVRLGLFFSKYAPLFKKPRLIKSINIDTGSILMQYILSRFLAQTIIRTTYMILYSWHHSCKIYGLN